MTEKYTDYYLTIAQASIAEFKDKGSKFIAFAYPVTNTDEFKSAILQTKALHPKASHYCFAYRMGINNNVYRVSDDGEPSGSAGKPILNAIDSKELTDVLVVVVRYFGGTLLGVPGLVNAYKNTTLLALQTTPLTQKPILIHYEIQFDYTQTNVVMNIVKQVNAAIFKNENQLFCVMKIGVQKTKEADFLHRFSEHYTIVVNKIKQ